MFKKYIKNKDICQVHKSYNIIDRDKITYWSLLLTSLMSLPSLINFLENNSYSSSKFINIIQKMN